MKTLLLLECKKAFQNKYFKMTLALALAVAISAGLYAGISAMNRMKIYWDFHTLKDGSMDRNPAFSMLTLYNTWIGGEFTTWGHSLFYFLLPMFAVLPYGWSLAEERKRGYANQMIVRVGRKKYYASKYLAAFISGATVIVLALTANYLTTACVVPALRPDAAEELYYAVPPDQFGSWLFWNQPLLYDVLYIVIASIFAGLWACIPIALSFFTTKRLPLLCVPFVALIGFQYFADQMIAPEFYLELSPLRFLQAHETYFATRGIIILGWFAALIGIVCIITWRKGTRNDVL